MTPILILLLLGSACVIAIGLKRARNTHVVEGLLEAQSGEAQETRILSPNTQRTEQHRRLVYWVSGAIAFVLVRALLGVTKLSLEPFFGLLGAVCAEQLWRSRRRSLVAREIRALEFSLPMAMERIVMAVGAGLDIVPALREAALGVDDPVSKLLAGVVDLSEGGIPVADSLRTIADGVPCLAVKHSFVHLALAHQQGGELVRPLKELSDATQAHYQDSVEEVIAGLPVKAVLPLVVTFAGLIVCFLTVPLMQIGSLTSKVSTSILER